MNPERGFRPQRALQISMAVSLVLAVVKIAAGIATHSLALFSSALDSLADFGNSIVNYIAAREASKPPDQEHAYGHEKIESLAGLFQSIVIAGGGFFLVTEAFRRFIHPQPLENAFVGVGVMIFSLIVTYGLSCYLRRQSKEQGSTILATEELHYSMDFLAGGGVLAALLLVKMTGLSFWDFGLAVLVSVYVLKCALVILKNAVAELLDSSVEPVTKQEIAALIQAHHPKIVGIHEFRSRKAGAKIFLDFHIEIRDEKDFRKAHDITESLVKEIKGKYAGADVTVHYDPEGED